MSTQPAKVRSLMQACQRGVAGKGPAIEAANNLLAECYGMLGKLAAENEALRKGLGGMLFAFDDGVGREWSANLLDYARALCPAAEFKS